VNTRQFASEKNIIHLDAIYDDQLLSNFIHSCDAMLWGRSDGETFGLAISEFSIQNKPIIATKNVVSTAHFEFLGDSALWYDENTLENILINFDKSLYINKDLNKFKSFSPEKVMKIFDDLIFEKNVTKKLENIPHDYRILNKTFKLHLLDDCYISKCIRSKQIWESHMHNVFAQYVNSNSIVIECGCHVGTHSLLLASLCMTFYGFEPMPETYDVLMKNIALNNINNAIIYKKGVADKEGVTRYSWIPENNPGAAALDNNPMGRPNLPYPDKDIEVELVTIDSLQLDKVDFMKIDVEGYETLVITGAINTIKKCRPIIIMEVWKDHCGVDIDYTKTIFKNLLELGYDVSHMYGPDFLFVPIYLNA
jgi:FkbM family methyltransferase